MVRLIKEQSCGHIWCALKVIMMIDTPIGSPNWAANYFIKRQAKRSPCLLPTKTCSLEPEGSFPSSVFPDAHNWHHNNSTKILSGISMWSPTRNRPTFWRLKMYLEMSTRRFEILQGVWSRGWKSLVMDLNGFGKRVLQKIGVKYHIWLQTVSCRDVCCNVRPVVLRLDVCCKNGFVFGNLGS